MNLIETEENYLFNAKMLLTVLLKEHFKKRKNQITPFEQIKLTKLIDRMIEGEIDYVRKTITTKSYSGQTQFKDVYELIIPDKKKYYVDSHITGSSINIYDSCANEYSSQDRYNEYVKKNNLKARKHPISDDCKYNKNTPRATVDTILFNLKTTRFIKSWLIEGEETQKRPRGNFGAQITYGLCSREN